MFDKETKILGVFAHREDHIVCGWPIFQNKIPRKFLVTCTSDGMTPFLQSCKAEHISCFRRVGLPNHFSFVGPGLRPEHCVKQIRDVLIDANRVIEPDFVFTHNPYGEYGHPDHRTVFNIVCEVFADCRIIFTDIIAKSSRTPLSGVKLRAYDCLFSNCLGPVEPDIIFYQRNAELFSSYQKWTKNSNLNLPEYPRPTNLYVMESTGCQRQKK